MALYIFTMFYIHFYWSFLKTTLQGTFMSSPQMTDEETETHGRSGSQSRDKTHSIFRLQLLPSYLLCISWLGSLYLPVQIHSPLFGVAHLHQQIPLPVLNLNLATAEQWREIQGLEKMMVEAFIFPVLFLGVHKNSCKPRPKVTSFKVMTFFLGLQ